MTSKENDGITLMDPNEMSFEQSYQELEKLVEKFETGKMTLTESIKNFERGILLLKRCSHELTEAEKKVSDLLQKIDPGQPLSSIQDTTLGLE